MATDIIIDKKIAVRNSTPLTETKENSVEQRKPKKENKLRQSNVLTYVILVLGVLFVIVPIMIMLITSFTPEIDADDSRFHWIPPSGFTLDAYVEVLTKTKGGISLINAFWNTIWMYFPSTLIGIISSSMAAYAFAKLDFKAKNFMFAVLMATLTLPNCMSTISSFLIFDKINWINTPLPIMIPRMLGTVSVMFFMKQYYAGIPDDLIGAGYLDGLDEISMFFKIMLPLSIPAMISQFILQFIAGYNDYLAPLLYLQDADTYTLQIALAFYVEAFKQNWPLRMAGATVAMMPLLLLYLLAQKYILKGVAVTTGLKG